MCDLSKPKFHNEDAARNYLERIRWPDGPACPFCGFQETVRPVRGKSMGKGWYYCKGCQDKFTVRVGTIYERSHIPLHKWVTAMHLMAASKKGISAHQLHRMLGITYKSAWFMAHRIREAMKDDNPEPMGGGGKTVEADETYLKDGPKKIIIETLPDGRRVPVVEKKYKKILALVERGGPARAFNLSSNMTAKGVRHALVTNVSRKSELSTDESNLYIRVGQEFDGHKRVYHSGGTYVDRDGNHTNTVEGYFSIFKRGMKGVYQHCGEQHLQRYLDEFSFRYSTRELEDAERAAIGHKRAEGKRLTYRWASNR